MVRKLTPVIYQIDIQSEFMGQVSAVTIDGVTSTDAVTKIYEYTLYYTI